MKIRLAALFACILLAAVCMAFAQAPAQPAQSQTQKRTVSGTLDRALGNVEKEFVDAADAMPEDKYGFAPTNGEFKGVRNFAEQVRHVAATNYMFGAAILNEKPPVPVEGQNENGPANIKSKADIMKYLRDSFAYLHKAVGSINEQNLVEPINAFGGTGNATRLGMATLTVGHCFDHYGQMVEYLRMNGIIPPASRKQ
jgi:uncharacterized damage-inducible protein DinB